MEIYTGAQQSRRDGMNECIRDMSYLETTTTTTTTTWESQLAATAIASGGILQLQDLLPGLAGKGAPQAGILPRLRTACLSQRMPRCDPLHDNRAPEGVERISPAQLSPADCPPAHFPIPPHTLVSRRQALDPLAPEPRLRRAALDVGIGARKIAQVGKRVADGRHLPVQHPYHPALRPVEDHVVDLVVPVDQARPVQRLAALRREKGRQLVKVRQLAHRLPRLDVPRARLRRVDRLERRQLPVVEVA